MISKVRLRAAAGFALLVLMAGCGGGSDEKAGACMFGPTCENLRAGGGFSTPAQTFSQSGTGDSAFTIPSGVEFVQIRATVQSTGLNFVLRLDNDLVVNTIIGSASYPTSHSGVYAVRGRRSVAITNAQGVAWTVTAVQVGTPSSNNRFALAGLGGDSVFKRPFSFLVATRTRRPTRLSRSLKVAEMR